MYGVLVRGISEEIRAIKPRQLVKASFNFELLFNLEDSFTIIDAQTVEKLLHQKFLYSQYDQTTMINMFMLGVITDARFSALYGNYEAEQAQLSPKIAALQERLEREESERGNLSSFIAMVSRYSDIAELDAVVLNDLIDHIVVHEAQGKGYKNRKQKIEIFYKFVGDMRFNEE